MVMGSYCIHCFCGTAAAVIVDSAETALIPVLGSGMTTIAVAHTSEADKKEASQGQLSLPSSLSHRSMTFVTSLGVATCRMAQAYR